MKVESKKDLTEQFGVNFYDKLIDKDLKNKKHDTKLEEYKEESTIPQAFAEVLGTEG